MTTPSLHVTNASHMSDDKNPKRQPNDQAGRSNKSGHTSDLGTGTSGAGRDDEPMRDSSREPESTPSQNSERRRSHVTERRGDQSRSRHQRERSRSRSRHGREPSRSRYEGSRRYEPEVPSSEWNQAYAQGMFHAQAQSESTMGHLNAALDAAKSERERLTDDLDDARIDIR